MNITFSLTNHKHRKIWSNLERKIQTLESFAQTETDAGESIKRAIKYVDNPTLRSHLLRHAEDECRHGLLFRNRAQALRKDAPYLSDASVMPDKLYQLTKDCDNSQINSHGFFTSDNFENKGEISYIAMLNVAEKKAEKLFSSHCSCLEDDPETYHIFKSILKDERYHVSYTDKFLQKWIKEGRSKEVKQALRHANESRILNAVTRGSSKFGQFTGTVILYVIYFTVVVPFAMISKTQKANTGWQPPKFQRSSKTIHSQY